MIGVKCQRYSILDAYNRGASQINRLVMLNIIRGFHMDPENQQTLTNKDNSHLAVNAPPDPNQIEAPPKTTDKPPPDEHHFVGAEGSPQKVSTSASTISEEGVEAEVTEKGSDKSPTTPAEECQASSVSTWLEFSNKIAILSTCFTKLWDKVKRSRDVLLNANSRRTMLVALVFMVLALLLRCRLIIVKLHTHIPSELSELYQLCYDPSLTLVMVVVIVVIVVVTCLVMLMNTKQLHYLKTILRIVGKIQRKLDWAIGILFLLL